MRIEFSEGFSAPIEELSDAEWTLDGGDREAMYRNMPWLYTSWSEPADDMLVSTSAQFMGVIDNPFNRPATRDTYDSGDPFAYLRELSSDNTAFAWSCRWYGA